MKLLRISILSLLILLGGLVGTAHADVNDFVINNFQTEYTIDNSKVGGFLNATEVIDLTFSDNNHGILRAIPATYQGFDTKLNVLSVQRDGASEPYKIEKQGSNNVIRIGDANKTITGAHNYKINYTQERIINFSDGKQSFYWDVNGTDWAQPFEKVSAKVLVKSASYGKFAPQCYTGTNQSQQKNCTVAQDGQYLNFSTTKPLGQNENMSVEIIFDGQPFAQPGLKNKIADNIWSILGIIPGILIAIYAFNTWWRKGRDYSGKGTIIPQYDPPKGLTPAEIGMLYDYNVDGKDISATIIDLAVRGYVRIHDDSKKVLFFKQRNFSLELMKVEKNSLKPHEATLLSAIFTGLEYKTGQKIELSKINKSSMQSAMSSAQTTIKKDLIDTHGLIEQESLKKQATLIVVGMVLLFVLIIIHPNTGFIIGGLIGGVTALICGFAMKRRSHAGVEMYEKVKGLQLYMNTAEKDRLKMMQSVDRPYAEPSKTVELFEKLLPFAVALGVEKSWSRQFESILTEPPSWYAGNSLAGFNAGQLASGIGSATQSFSSSVESSSGSSGGSGGGGGGGGGGGW